MRYKKKRLDYQFLKGFFQSALAVFFISMSFIASAETCCDRYIQFRITAPKSISAWWKSQMIGATQSGFTTKGPQEQSCPIRVELNALRSPHYLIDCEVKVLPSDIKGQYFMFYAKLIDPNHGNAVLAGPHHVSWHGEPKDFFIPKNMKSGSGSRSLLMELIQYLRPFDDKIEDHERIPESCTIEPEKDEVEGGESITIKLTNIKDAKNYTSKSWQRLAVKVDIGKIKNGENKHPFYIFEVNKGLVEIQYEAPEKCDFDTEIITVFNSCETKGPLFSTHPHREIARREIKVDDFQPVRCNIEPEKKKLNPGENITIRLSDFVEFEGRKLRPIEKIMVKAQEGRITNGKPHGKYRIFTIGNGIVSVAYRAPDQSGVEKDTITVQNVCENSETGEIEPKKEIAKTTVKIKHSSVYAKITYTKNSTRDFSETKPQFYNSSEQSNMKENIKFTIYLECEEKPRIDYKFDKKSLKMKVRSYTYQIKSARIQSELYEGQTSTHNTNIDATGVRHDYRCKYSKNGTDFQLTPQSSRPTLQIRIDPATGMVKKVHLPYYTVTGIINHESDCRGAERKRVGADETLVPYDQKETRTSDLKISLQPTVKNREECSKVADTKNVKFLRGECSQIRKGKYLTEELRYDWEVVIRGNQ